MQGSETGRRTCPGLGRTESTVVRLDVDCPWCGLAIAPVSNGAIGWRLSTGRAAWPVAALWTAGSPRRFSPRSRPSTTHRSSSRAPTLPDRQLATLSVRQRLTSSCGTVGANCGSLAQIADRVSGPAGSVMQPSVDLEASEGLR
jgi:hypothetical protein